MSAETLTAFSQDGKVILETREGYYYMTAKDAADLGWAILKLCYRLDEKAVYNVLNTKLKVEGPETLQ